MDSVDFQDEELSITEPVSLSFHGFDFIAGTLQQTG